VVEAESSVEGGEPSVTAVPGVAEGIDSATPDGGVSMDSTDAAEPLPLAPAAATNSPPAPEDTQPAIESDGDATTTTDITAAAAIEAGAAVITPPPALHPQELGRVNVLAWLTMNFPHVPMVFALGAEPSAGDSDSSTEVAADERGARAQINAAYNSDDSGSSSDDIAGDAEV
jgi:hypothetical protein